MRAHDEQFRQFVADRSAELLRLAYLLCGERTAAEDLVQTALLRAYTRWHRIETPGAYVRRVLVTVAADEGRRAHRRRERSQAEPPERADPAEPYAAAEADAGLLAALRALPPRQRAAVVLRHWLDLSPDEAAELLGCSAETVRSQTQRGLAKLRAAYRPSLTTGDRHE
jgi:RNA polymerase sigma-70 factor (sigma-E family)